MRDALLALLAEERRKFMTGGGLCLQTVLKALVETREASLQVVEAITRCAQSTGPRTRNNVVRIKDENVRLTLLGGNLRNYNLRNRDTVYSI